MEQLINKILHILKEEGIDVTETRDVLSKVSDGIDGLLWEKISVSLPLLYNLKDTVWYNLEHLPSGGVEKGISDLKTLGSKYPILMYNGNSSFYINNEDVSDLLIELEDIRKKWNNSWSFVQLFTKSLDGWNGGKDKPSPVVIYDPGKGESPTKYGYKYTTQQFGLYDPKGEFITSEKQEMVLCSIEMKLGTYGREPLLKNLLDRLIMTCKQAIEKEKGIMLNSAEFDYEN